MKILKLICAALASTLLMAACGGGSNTLTGVASGSSSGGSSGGGTTPPTQIGATIGGSFTANAVGVGLAAGAQLGSGGSTQLTVEFRVTTTGTLVADSIVVAFSSQCPAGTVVITPNPATTVGGIASATYQNQGGCSLTQDIVTATVQSGGVNLITPATATGTIALAQSTAGSIAFVNALPTNIGLQGTGRQETSAVTFQVLSTAGGPQANATVVFTLSTTLGGITLQPASAITGADGKAQTTVKSGTRATSVRVTATTTVGAGPISTQSNLLTITTGIPDERGMSMGVSCPNVEAWDIDGVIVPVTLRMTDRFQNPVPDGTAATFTASGGGVQGSCTTTTTPLESGVCTVNWVSKAPRPNNPAFTNGAGRVVLLGVAIGEDSFTDVNGNGVFDAAETLANIHQKGDPYLDVNENRAYDIGEQFFDINASSTYNGPSGLYAGLLCSNPTLCAPQSTTYVGASALIIMSGSTAFITDNVGGVLDVTANGSGTVVFSIADLNNQPLPAGTTVAFSGPTGVTVGNPSTFTIPCTSTPGPIQYGFSVTRSAVGGQGLGTLLVTTKGGIQTVYTITVKY